MEINAGLDYKMLMKSKNSSNETNIKIFPTVLRPIMTYVSDALTRMEQNKNRLNVAESKGIYGSVRDNVS